MSSNRPQREGSSEGSKNEKNGDDQKVDKDIILATLDGEKIQLFSVGGGEIGSKSKTLREQDGGGAAREEAPNEGLSSGTERGNTPGAMETPLPESTAKEDLKQLPAATASTGGYGVRARVKGGV